MQIEKIHTLQAKLAAMRANPPEIERISGSVMQSDGTRRPEQKRGPDAGPMTVVDLTHGTIQVFEHTTHPGQHGWSIRYGRGLGSVDWFSFKAPRIKWAVSEEDFNSRLLAYDHCFGLVRHAKHPSYGHKQVFADLAYSQGGLEYTFWLLQESLDAAARGTEIHFG
jgi:hypothetical protein